ILASAERYVFKIVAYDNVGHSSAGVDATFEIIGADVARLGATEYVVEQNGALCLAATGETPEGWTYYWDLSGSEVEVSSNFIERGSEFWTSVEELGFGVGERTIRMRPRDANGIFGPTVAATLRVVATAPTFNVTTSSSVDGSILRLSLQATTPDDSPIARWRLDWGDGQTSEFAQLSDALTAGHYYAPTAEDAVYEVSLTVVDATGNGSDVVYALTSHSVPGSGTASQATAWTVEETSGLGGVEVAKETADIDAASFEVAEASLEALSVETKSVSVVDNVDATVLTATETAFDSASRGGYRLSLPDAISAAERFDAAFASLEAVASTSVLDGGEFATDCGADVWSEIETALVADEASRKKERRDPFESLDVWADDELEGLGAFGF
ncbi:MAG: hypothetical protein IJO06_00080, partial [Thermoguttaceae bacterium]|nr:hypothetical protein [Thermoguttaceae bacterium]